MNTMNPAVLYKNLVKETLSYTIGDNKDTINVIVANIEGNTKYVLKLHGAGLWGGIGGYLALDADKNTIFGVNFNHESETPGLGGEIVTEKFRKQFIGKHIRNLRRIEEGTEAHISFLWKRDEEIERLKHNQPK